MPDLTLYRATVTAYDPATHSAAVTLLEGPAAALAGVRCTLQCAAAELTAGQRCLVLILADSQALLIATY